MRSFEWNNSFSPKIDLVTLAFQQTECMYIVMRAMASYSKDNILPLCEHSYVGLAYTFNIIDVNLSENCIMV